MITLILLNPLQSLPPQSWTFEDEPIIRIGRSTDNDVVLYSAVVSRRHVELRRVNNSWEIVSLGANGTFLNGKQIQQTPVSDGIVLRLARSGPQIKIRLGILTLEEIRQSISEHYSQAASSER
ncbi:MAG: FHA domain-containing protein [Calothrix sp. MO_192.B10]|nr:FHA domain-containing protein [Calothrix sp. MO_192.B10]